MAKGKESGLFSVLTHFPYVWLFGIATILLDQITKNLILRMMNPGESIPLLAQVFHLTFVQNTGIAFGLFQNANLLFIFLALGIIIAIIFSLPHIGPKEKLLQVGFGLLLGGACGNLIDRIFLGYVVDFIDFRIWPVFNVADSAISISVVLLALLLWKK